MRGIADQSVANSYPPEVRHNAEDFRKFRARWLANDPQSFAAINRMLADSMVTDELPRIARPTLVIGCTHDKLRPPSDIEPMARQIPNAEYLEINSGHFAGRLVLRPLFSRVSSQRIHCCRGCSSSANDYSATVLRTFHTRRRPFIRAPWYHSLRTGRARERRIPCNTNRR